MALIGKLQNTNLSSYLLCVCITGLHVQKVYTSLGTSSMQILLLSAHACIHFARELQLQLRTFGVRL